MFRTLLLSSIALFGLGQSHLSAEMIINPDDKNLRYIGRFTEDYRFAWTGCAIEAEFTGSQVTASFKTINTKKTIAMTAVLDGEEQVIYIKPGQEDYLLGSGLKEGKHRLLLFRRSEASFGVLQFKGLKLSEGSKLTAPHLRTRKIHVIGDSITCGYGNEAATLQEGNTVENENGYMSYAAITARRFDADIVMTCWSGKGMSRNGPGNTDHSTTIPKLFDYILPKQKKEIYQHKNFIPDVFVINLGTNDLRKQGRRDLQKEPYVKAYKNFIKRLRNHAPNAHIILTIGPMQTKPIDTWLNELAAATQKTEVLVFDGFKSADEKGGHYHPSVKKDKLMADQLISKIKSLGLNWNQ